MVKTHNSPLKRFMSEQWAAALIGNILLFLILAVSQPAFLQATNIMNILCQCSLFGIMAIGMTFVISTGGIDISVGMNALFTMALMYRLNSYGIFPVWTIFLIVLVVGCLIGLLNGFMASVLNFPDMIATLATMSILRGAAYLLLDNSQKFVDAPLRVIGNSKLFQMVPTPTVLMIIMTVIGILALRFTRFGRYVLAVGGSKNSAVFSGLNVTRIRIGAYVICGVCAALGGIVYAGRIGSIAPNSCMGYEFTVITAVVLGGTKMSGGKSSIVGSALGCVFLYLIENAMTMLDISSYYQVFARAVMMLCAIAIDTATTMRNNASVVRERRARFLQIQ
ncbi:ABC transporter permease [uncultured Anaerotruncus sp.]|uniref:ABC transporter permease n=1 Tax=uncultured Anaerotruncus sp. TaxID=905011 RepID=UPI00280AE981|nr:ABC transporter permease [uncultured Anaerotruncus sp.]